VQREVEDFVNLTFFHRKNTWSFFPPSIQWPSSRASHCNAWFDSTRGWSRSHYVTLARLRSVTLGVDYTLVNWEIFEGLPLRYCYIIFRIFDVVELNSLVLEFTRKGLEFSWLFFDLFLKLCCCTSIVLVIYLDTGSHFFYAPSKQCECYKLVSFHVHFLFYQTWLRLPYRLSNLHLSSFACCPWIRVPDTHSTKFDDDCFYYYK